jgi:hypothetical protein
MNYKIPGAAKNFWLDVEIIRWDYNIIVPRTEWAVSLSYTVSLTDKPL